MTVITMSRTEIDRMGVLHDLADGRIKIAEASTLMGLGRRQVFRLAKAYGKHGPEALVSRRRGRPSNRCYPTALRAEVIGHHRGSLFRLWSDASGGEACGAARDSSCVRDTPAMDDHGRPMEGSPSAFEACPPAAASARLCGRTDPDRRVGALVVRDPWSAMHPARLH